MAGPCILGFINALLFIRYISVAAAFLLPASASTNTFITSHPPQVTSILAIHVPELRRRQAQMNTCTGWSVLNKPLGKINILAINSLLIQRLLLTPQMRRSIRAVHCSKYLHFGKSKWVPLAKLRNTWAEYYYIIYNLSRFYG